MGKGDRIHNRATRYALAGHSIDGCKPRVGKMFLHEEAVQIIENIVVGKQGANDSPLRTQIHGALIVHELPLIKQMHHVTAHHKGARKSKQFGAGNTKNLGHLAEVVIFECGLAPKMKINPRRDHPHLCKHFRPCRGPIHRLRLPVDGGPLQPHQRLGPAIRLLPRNEPH